MKCGGKPPQSKGTLADLKFGHYTRKSLSLSYKLPSPKPRHRTAF
jgi:hypothetical protein